MVELTEELMFQYNNATGFESYMFATTDKHIVRHKILSDMQCIILDKGRAIPIKGEMLEDRKKALEIFNKTMKDSVDIDMHSQAKKCHMTIVYFGIPEKEKKVSWVSEYKQIRQLLINFTREQKCVLGMTTHFHQFTDTDRKQLNYPHLHVVYNTEHTRSQVLNKYLQKNL